MPDTSHLYAVRKERFPTRCRSFYVREMLPDSHVPARLSVLSFARDVAARGPLIDEWGRDSGGRAVNFMNFRGEKPMGSANIGTFRGAVA